MWKISAREKIENQNDREGEESGRQRGSRNPQSVQEEPEEGDREKMEAEVGSVIAERIETPEPVLRDADPLAEPELEASLAEMIEHADLFHQPQRVVEGQQVDQRAQTDPRRPLRRSGEEDVDARRRVERDHVVLGLVVPPEPGLLGPLDETEPVVVQPVQRHVTGVLKLVEHAEAQPHGPT